jgi:hypothetical protein
LKPDISLAAKTGHFNLLPTASYRGWNGIATDGSAFPRDDEIFALDSAILGTMRTSDASKISQKCFCDW